MRVSDDVLGLAVGVGVAPAVEEVGAEVVLVGVGAVLVLEGVGAAVVVAAGGVVGVSAMTSGEPNGVSARATDIARAPVTTGYATTVRRRMRRGLPFIVRFKAGSGG